jgi:hypothetical protein
MVDPPKYHIIPVAAGARKPYPSRKLALELTYSFRARGKQEEKRIPETYQKGRTYQKYHSPIERFQAP